MNKLQNVYPEDGFVSDIHFYLSPKYYFDSTTMENNYITSFSGAIQLWWNIFYYGIFII